MRSQSFCVLCCGFELKTWAKFLSFFLVKKRIKSMRPNRPKVHQSATIFELLNFLEFFLLFFAFFLLDVQAIKVPRQSGHFYGRALESEEHSL